MDDAKRIADARAYMYANYDTVLIDLLPQLSIILDIPNNDECHKFCIGIFIKPGAENVEELLKIRNRFNMPQSIPTLQELAFMYGTDKMEHGYMDFYEKYLPKNPKKILEIGVREGKSIMMWQKYFPEAEIHGMDLFQEFDKPSIPNVKWWKGSQTDQYILEQLDRENFDLIIDDASHVSRHQMITFFSLFNGKHYFIEDTHCCYEDFYRVNMPLPITARDLFANDHLEGLETIRGKNIILIKCS